MTQAPRSRATSNNIDYTVGFSSHHTADRFTRWLVGAGHAPAYVDGGCIRKVIVGLAPIAVVRDAMDYAVSNDEMPLPPSSAN